MLITISEKSKKAFEAAAIKLGQPTTLPDFSMLRPDLALWLTANYMLAIIIEADKNGEIRDYNNHSTRKYWPWHYTKDGYEPGSGGGFSYRDYACDGGSTAVGSRLTLNSWGEAKNSANDYPDLWEIVKLTVK